ncbi:hypothetical protein [Sphingomonas melonis]|uniref:Uncharacterized protein n=1 Tax=Sphingomonas melonis TaxID=152682 RepID=A0A7Y9K4W9_9SPHN|nr:hypothetical protein [Sphingomonas melonis]NYD91820.1 hypothetical protein [Sphingomonas melonis]
MTYLIIAAAVAIAAVATYAYGHHRQRVERRSVARRRLTRAMAGARAGVTAPRQDLSSPQR